MSTVFFVLFLMFGMAKANEMGAIVNSVEEVNSLRETMVLGVPDKVDKKVFKAVCGPVGKRAKELSKKNNWVFKQVSHKNRNPKNKADKVESLALKRFKKDKKLKSFWMELDGKSHYFRRINVQGKCLACHGPKADRPAFVLKKYPKDKAFGFKKDGLRGLYHVYSK